MRIIGFEADPLERELLKAVLDHEGFRVTFHADEEPFVREAFAEPAGLAIVGVEEPERALALVRRLRAGATMPIVAIGPRPDDETTARLYEAGCDEVIGRPISPRVLVARLDNMRRRSMMAVVQPEADADRVQVGEFKLVPTLQQLHVRGRVVQLTPLQTRLLFHLMANAGHIVPRARLEDKLWGCAGEAYGQHIKTHICHLRRKLETVEPGLITPIQTVKGTGYLFQKAAA